MGYPRKSQTVTATPAKPGELSILLVVSQPKGAVHAVLQFFATSNEATPERFQLFGAPRDMTSVANYV